MSKNPETQTEPTDIEALRAQCQSIITLARYLTEAGGEMAPCYNSEYSGFNQIVIETKDGSKYDIAQYLCKSRCKTTKYDICIKRPDKSRRHVSLQIEKQENNEIATSIKSNDYPSNKEKSSKPIEIDLTAEDVEIDPSICKILDEIEKTMEPTALRFSDEVAKGIRGGIIERVAGLYPQAESGRIKQ